MRLKQSVKVLPGAGHLKHKCKRYESRLQMYIIFCKRKNFIRKSMQDQEKNLIS